MLLQKKINQMLDGTAVGDKAVQKIGSIKGKYLTLEQAAKGIHSLTMQNLAGPNVRDLRENNRKYIVEPPDVMMTLRPQMMAPRLSEALTFKSIAYVKWASLVGPGAEWDLKVSHEPLRKVHWYLYDHVSGCQFGKDIFGNIHYGYIGMAAGFSEDELKDGAGAAQILTILKQLIRFKDQPLREALQRFKVQKSFAAFDPPDDAFAVSIGIEQWKKYGSELDLQSYINDIRTNKSSLQAKC